MRMIRRIPHTALLGFGMLLCLIFVAIFGPIITTRSPFDMDPPNRLQPPGATHPFGTDSIGRDIFTRVVYGTRISIRIGITVVLLASGVGSTVGIISGYYGGKIDQLLMRIVDIFMSIPYIILAMLISALLGPSIYNAMFAMAIVWWPVYARLIRAQVLLVRQVAYIEAAKALGCSNWRIISKHVLPNSWTPVIVQGTLDFGRAVIYSASLSFLGLGAQPPMPEWGAMINQGRDYLSMAWWYITFPGLAIAFTGVAFNLVGDGLRDILDPQLRREK